MLHSSMRPILAMVCICWFTTATGPLAGALGSLAAAAGRPNILIAISDDPGCLKNLAEEPQLAATRQQLTKRLLDYLEQTGDARVIKASHGDIWETYPRYSPLRWFPTPTWARQHPAWVPTQDWLEQRRPSILK